MDVLSIQIRQSLVPVLLLATVAISTSNVLPVLSINQLETEPADFDGQLNDNIFRINRNEPRNILNDIFYTISITTPQNNRQIKELQYVDIDNNNKPEDESNIMNREDVYNGEGFRKEQWHNYPRQLDRLHEYLNTNKRTPDPDDPYDDNDGTPEPNQNNEVNTNEFHLTTKDENGYESVIAATNPFLIFKIHLACLNDKLKNTNINSATDYMSSEPEYIPNDKKEIYESVINPEVSVTKVKREEEHSPQSTGVSDNSITKNRAVKKRIFSLWSRLQSFNHKGHELQHRRHLHAYYGLPDGGGGGVLTAETRATFMRPPGSPLRWG
ncbi:hypothetical protein evm_011847 [Chilo suppressalis]|nr:hypothetical protein evm_011847 [Chilo suppressalis]